jgi:hypothetical protein
MSAESAIVVGSAATDHSQKRGVSFQSETLGGSLKGLIPTLAFCDAACNAGINHLDHPER